MVAFSFTFNPYIYIAGLVLTGIQTIQLKAYNLTFLNLIGIIGGIYKLFTWQQKQDDARIT